MAMGERDKEFSFVIKKQLGVINSYQTGWRKELNLVEWNGTAAKLDIRDWDPEHGHMSRGITLRKEEAENLFKLLFNYLKEEGRQVDISPPAAEG